MSKIIISLIIFYQKFISPLKPASVGFTLVVQIMLFKQYKSMVFVKDFFWQLREY